MFVMNGYDRYDRRARIATFGVALAAAVIAIVMNGMQAQTGQPHLVGPDGAGQPTSVVSGETPPVKTDPTAVSFG
jgi:hypothetical protein